MNFESYFKFASYGLVITAFLALVLTGEVDPFSVSLYLVALFICITVDVRRSKRFRLREWMWRLLAIAYVPFVFVDAAFLSPKILALVHMTLFLSAAKLFQEKTDRDWVFLYLIAFFQILLAAGLTFNAVFVCALTTFIFFFVSTLAAFEIKRSRLEAASSGEEIIRREETRRTQNRRTALHAQAAINDGPKRSNGVRYLLGASSTLLAFVAIFTLPLFFLIPRSSAAGISTGIDFQTLTGFSDTVNLGDVSKLKTSSRIVMRVKLDRNPGRWLRWRGIALDHYDGRAWTFTNEPRRSAGSLEEGRFNGTPGGSSFVRDYLIDGVLNERGITDSGEIWDETDQAPANSFLKQRDHIARNLLKEEIILEPLTGPTLFSASRLERIRGPLRSLYVQDTRAVSTEPHRNRIEYSAWSDLSEPGEDELRADNSYDYPQKIRRLYLQLPSRARNPIPLDPRISHLAHQIADGQKSPYDKARAIERYLKTNYTYTLDVKPTDGDPLAEFLFDTRAGFCEYFATAMAVMLRAVDIPTRVVNGFQMGEYNQIGDFYTIRERDAHSWVEVYFPANKTWVEFDPTPSAGINDYSNGGVAARIRQLIDSFEAFWMDYVVTLDHNEQASIMVALQYRLRMFRETVMSSYMAFRYWLMNQARWLLVERKWTASQLIGRIIQLAVILFALFGLYALWSYLKTRRLPPSSQPPWWRRLFVLPAWKRKKDSKTSAVMFYEQMLAMMSSRGLVKQADQTPLEFAQANSGIIQVLHLTEIYNRVRFGGEPLGDLDRHMVDRLLSEIKKLLRRSRVMRVSELTASRQEL